jgi:hypothetical protein
MCARVIINDRVYRPGDLLPVKSATKAGQGKWAGFARLETLEAVWGADWVELEIPVEEFAENNKNTGTLEWGVVPFQEVVSAIGNRKTHEVKIVTREADAEEKARFGHHRLPVFVTQKF